MIPSIPLVKIVQSPNHSLKGAAHNSKAIATRLNILSGDSGWKAEVVLDCVEGLGEVRIVMLLSMGAYNQRKCQEHRDQSQSQWVQVTLRL